MIIALALLGPMVLSASPTAPAARARAWVDGDRLVVSRRVMFRPGEFQTTAESRAVLEAMAVALRDLPPDTVIVIEGHSDAGGDEVENLRLSQARADYVAAALVKRGVDAAHVQAVGVGSARPLVGPDSREQYRNRRIEILLRPSSSPTPTPTIAPARVSTLDSLRTLIPLLDDDDAPALNFKVPLLEDGPIIMASAAPRVPLLDDDDLMMLTRSWSPAGAAPRIPLLDMADAPRGIGLVD